MNNEIKKAASAAFSFAQIHNNSLTATLWLFYDYIVECYIRADIEKRVEIILDNYGMFNRFLDGYEQSLSIVIRNERDYNRKGSWLRCVSFTL